MSDLEKMENEDLLFLSDLVTLMYKCKTKSKLTFDEIEDELLDIHKKYEAPKF